MSLRGCTCAVHAVAPAIEACSAPQERSYGAAPVLCAWGTGGARPSPTLCPVLRARGGGDARAPGLCATLDAPLSECSDAQLPKRLPAWQGPESGPYHSDRNS